MSYDKCKAISLKPRTNQIFITVASNNIRPLYYCRYEYASRTNCNFEDKLRYLMISMLDGNIQISQLNKNTIPFEYALIKVKNFYRKNDINEYGDKYDKRHELFEEKLSEYVNIENWQEKTQFIRDNKELVDEVERNINRKLYKEEFEIFKNCINERIEEKYYLKDDLGKTIQFVRETNQGYKYRIYESPNDDCLIDYKLAYIQNERMGNKYEICKYERIIDENTNIKDEENEETI